jgi:hypothetical protein
MATSPEPENQQDSTYVDSQQMEERPAGSPFNIGLEALAEASTFQYTRPAPGILPADAHASPHASNNLNFILNPAGPEVSMGTFLTCS